MKTGVKVADAMTKKPVIVSQDLTIKECSKAMLKEKVGSVVIKENNKAIGILSEKDIVDRLVARSKDPEKTLAKDIMSTKLITISSRRDILEALQLMKLEKISKLPVVDNGSFVGLLTTNDIIKLQPALLEIYLDKIEIKEHEDKISRYMK